MSRKFLLTGISLIIIVIIGVSSFYNVESKKQIYVFLPSADNPFWIDVKKGVEDTAQKHTNVFKVTILTTNSIDASNQIDQLQSILNRRKVDGILIGIANNKAPAPIIAQYNKENIPVVMIDTDLDKQAAQQTGAKWDSFIGSDNFYGGKIAALAMIEGISESENTKVLLIKGSYIHQSAIDRAEGFIEGAKNKLEIIERDGEWSRQKATEITAGLLSRQPIAGIFASNDEMALGAVAAIKNLGLTQRAKPLIIGFDATSSGIAAINRGDMYASIKQQSSIMGASGLLNVIYLINGKRLDNPKTLIPVEVVYRSDFTK